MSSVAARVVETTLSETAYFSVHATAEPGVMPRVLELFAKRGLVPSGWRSARSGADQAQLAIEIEMRGLGCEAADYIAACLRQIASVEIVSTCRPARRAGAEGALAADGVP
ncbi:MAG TPA: hypothetical protein VGM07_06780 [Stellaceae bacterium]